MFAAIVYRPVGVGKQRTHAAHVLPGPYASRQLAHQAGVAYAKQRRLSPLDVGTLEASKVGQFFQGTGSHYIRENPSRRRSALPSKWTPATVTRKGGKIQIRVGGRR